MLSEIIQAQKYDSIYMKCLEQANILSRVFYHLNLECSMSLMY
jgi:hypothetical protein